MGKYLMECVSRTRLHEPAIAEGPLEHPGVLEVSSANARCAALLGWLARVIVNATR